MKKLISILILLFLPHNVWAGQLIVDVVSLSEIARFGFAIMGTVMSVNVSKNTVGIKRKKAWARKENERFILSHENPAIENKIEEFSIYQGVVWSDPGKSPLDRRVRNALHLTEVKVGQEVLLVFAMKNELIKADENMLRKMDLLFSEEKLEHYLKKAQAATLYKDLQDDDLRELALEAMSARNLLDPEAFLNLQPSVVFKIGWKLGKDLPAPTFDKWLASMVKATRDNGLRRKLADLAREPSLADKITDQTRINLMKSLDLNDEDQRNILSWYVSDETNALKENPDQARSERVTSFSLDVLAKRKDTVMGSEFEALRKLLESLPHDKQVEYTKRIGKLVMTSENALKTQEKIDENLFGFFISQVIKNPDIAYLPELAGIDLSLISKISQRQVEDRVSLLKAGLAIAKNKPSESHKIFNALKKWTTDQSLFKPSMVMSLDSESPESKKNQWSDVLNEFLKLEVRD